jgi:transcriptional regulator with XRE-family HTH domain
MQCPKYVFSFILFFITSYIYADLKLHQDSCTPPPVGGQYNSCEILNPHQNPETGNAILVSEDNKYNIPLAARVGSNRTQVSNIRTGTGKNHPSGSTLFAGAGNLGGLLDNFLDSIDEDNQHFLVYFSKIHLLILHEIYQYLMSIYVTFNMTHVSTVEEHLINQTTQALNKKTMIINHLFSIIEAQSNKAILMRFPNLPEHIASKAGKMIMKNDYGADLNLMLEKQEEMLFADQNVQTYYKDRREKYLDIFGRYLNFFKSYTATLEQQDPIYGSKFVQYAKDVQKVINTHSSHFKNVQKQLKNTDAGAKVKALREIKTINPPLFFYDEATFRGMKIIPRLAKDLPKKSENVPWPKKLVEDAKNPQGIKNKWGNVISNQPPAYFKNAQGQVTPNLSDAVSLYVNIPTLQNMYTQEVLPQPDWLNSYDGVMMMLRACLGDFTAIYSPQLKDELILDPCLSCIVLKSAQKAGISLPGTDLAGACDTCQTYLASLQKIIGWEKPAEEQPVISPTDQTQQGGDQEGPTSDDLTGGLS